MKHYLFLSLLLAVLHLSKAGPLRLQKRAAFYIANETACVVDNIVYSNGDPIPTDDPCESCKCRPPGFACVLKECKAKPGCRAVRQVGRCCPEYVCDVPERTSFIGEKNVLPPANLLPELYDESILPGDLPSTQAPKFTEKETDPTKAPTAEDIFVETAAPEVKESSDDESGKPLLSTESEIPVIEEAKSSDPEFEKNNPEVVGEEKLPSEEEKDIAKEESTDKEESVEETKVLFNSETEIKKEDNVEVTTVKETTEEIISTEESSVSTESVPEVREEDPQTTPANDVEEHETKATEKLIEIVSTSTEVPVTEKGVKNSAADNSKSLKLTEVEILEEQGKGQDSVKEYEAAETQESENIKKNTEALTPNSDEELPSKVESDATKAIDSTENNPEPEENAAEESVPDPQSIPFYANDDKVIKKESAETVTIVVHVREKTRPPTVTDFETEKTTAESSTGQPAEVLLKSNDELENIEIFKESTEVEISASTGKNFEVFPGSTEISTGESSTSSPEQPEEKVEARSETDLIDSDVEKTTSKQESDLKPIVEVSSTTATNQEIGKDDTEVIKEARAGEEIIEETKEEELKVAEISADDPKIEKVEEEVKVAENPEEVNVTEKPEETKVTEKQEETKITEIKVENPNISLKTDSEVQTSKIEEIKVEPEIAVREEETKQDEKVEELKSEEKEPKSEEILEETKLEEKVEESVPEEKVEESKPEKKIEESNPEEIKIEEKGGNDIPGDNVESKSEEEKEDKSEEGSETTEEKVEGTNVESTGSEEKREDKQPEEIKELKDQVPEKSNQHEEPKDSK